MGTNDFRKTIRIVVIQLLSVLNTRNRDIIARRFGLRTGDKQTLESIGKTYGITRERVRQIEEASIKILRDHIGSGFSSKIQPFITIAASIIEQSHGIINEKELFLKFSDSSKPSVANAALVFFLMLDGKLKRNNDDDDFRTFWNINAVRQQEFINSVNIFIKSFEKNKQPLEEAKFADFCTTYNLYFKEPLASVLSSILSISKRIDRNVFGEIGLSSWAQIRPRGVRDKSFMVLKRSGESKHFTEITRLINESNFNKNKANVQTVHNELIKDKRFVLVGRGMYALAEWGYKPGTIKQLIVELIKQKGMLSKEQIVNHVMSVRFVKSNTILLGLQDKKLFQHDANGKIELKKA